MSTLKLENIQHPDSSTPAISLDSSGGMSGSFPYPNRNLIYNGAMQVHQRGTSSSSITTSGYYTADRWQVYNDGLGTWTQTVENDAPNGSGFRKSLKMLVTTADASPGAGDHLRVNQVLEGQDVQRILKGTSNAKEMTVSFWVKSNTPGTYTLWVYDGDNNRSVSKSYTINSSATWEYKTILIPADTTGVLDNDNAASLYLSFWLGSGTSFTSGTLQTSWNTFTGVDTAVGQTNLAASVNNYWQITGVQLETGSVATEFEHLPFGIELLRCKRYYQKSFLYETSPQDNITPNSIIPGSAAINIAGGSTSGVSYNQGRVNFEIEMRAEPSTVDLYQPNGSAGNAGALGKFGDFGNGSVSTSYNAVVGSKSSKGIVIQFNGGNGYSNGSNPYAVHWTASAEL